jgi:hypothetical protein
VLDYLTDPAYTGELLLLGLCIVLVVIFIIALTMSSRIPPRVQRRYPHAYRIAKVRQQGRNGFKSQPGA